MCSMASSSVDAGMLDSLRLGAGLRASASSGRCARLRRAGLFWAGLAALALGAGACASDPPPPPPSPLTPTTDVENVVSALELLETDPEMVAAEGVSEMVGDLRSVLPPGATIEADPTTWAPDGTGLGGVITVSVVAEGVAAAHYLAVMVREPGGWKVLATVPEDVGGAS